MKTLKHSTLGAMIGNQRVQPYAAPLPALADAIPSGGGRSIGRAGEAGGHPRNRIAAPALVKPVRFSAMKSICPEAGKIEKSQTAGNGAGAGRDLAAGLGEGPGGLPYVYRWNRQGRKGEACRLIARGTMNSRLIEFADGGRMVTSGNALRRAR